MRVRVLHVFPYYCPPGDSDSGGGTKTALRAILAALDHSIYENYVLLPAPSEEHDSPLRAPGGNTLLYLGEPTHLVIEFSRMSVRYLVAYAALFWRCIFGIRRIVRDHRIHLIHSHGSGFLGAAIAGRLCRVPVVLHVHEYPFRFPRRLQYLYHRIVPYFGDYVICCADFIRRAFVDASYPASRIRTVYNGIDTAVYRSGASAQLRDELKLSPRTWLVGFVGRLSPRKGVEYFLEAARLVAARRDDVEFVVVGDGHNPLEREYRRKLLAIAETSGQKVRIHFLGARADMANVYGSLDLLVFPSPQDMGPYVPLEAMAMGVPVIAASEGGAREEVEDNLTGIHVPPRAPEHIAEAIVRLLADTSTMKRMGEAGRRRVEQAFSQQRFASEVAEVYEVLLRNLSRGRKGEASRRILGRDPIAPE